MIEMLQLPFIVHALIGSIIMGLLLSYLGVHVVKRGIVFVDLALGQISSLGAAFAAFIGGALLPISITFTLLGAVLLSLIHIHDKRLKQEAIIGIIYAVASAVTVLLISKTPHGEADISEVLFGAILAIGDAELISMGIVFATLGLLHLTFYREFNGVTGALREGRPRKDTYFVIFNFLFYFSIGLAIVLGVRAGGVIPVFSYLVIPSVTAILLSRVDIIVTLLASVFAVLVSFFGLYFSFSFDFPAGSSIVAVFGMLFGICGVIKLIRHKELKPVIEVEDKKEDLLVEPLPTSGDLGFNLGAFLLSALWLMFHGKVRKGIAIAIIFSLLAYWSVVLGVLGFILGLIIQFLVMSYLGSVGNGIASKYKGYSSIDQLKKKQRPWMIAGFIVWVIGVIPAMIRTLVFLMS